MDAISDTVEGGAWISMIVLILSAAAALIGSLWALQSTPKGGEEGGETQRNASRGRAPKGGEEGGETQRNASRGRDVGCPCAVVERQRRNPQLIGDLVARPAFLHAFQAAVEQLQAAFPSRHRRSFENSALNAVGSSVCSENRLLLITGGRLCALLARRLLCFNGKCAVRDALRLGTSALSRRHFFRNSSATCVATLEGHCRNVTSVAFHPTAPLLATGSGDNTVRLWLLSCDNSSATCVANLEGHCDGVSSVAFHPTAPLLATGSGDNTVRLWLLSCDNSSATCVANLEGHCDGVSSVAFHPTAPLLATGSGDNTVRLWLLSCDNSSATCVATLEGHRGGITSVAFHPTAPLLATGSWEVVGLWC
jgi:hypothetical protein